MFTQAQKMRLLEIARSSIQTYLKTGTKLKVEEKDPQLVQELGAFVTLRSRSKSSPGQEEDLRGCIGTMVGTQPLYLTIRDMAVEAATADPRFPAVRLAELGGLRIEISVLSPLEKAASADMIELGTHGVLVRRGFRSGVFLPQVADETGWSKEEFLSYLCSHKAGLPADAWKDPATELYVFTATVFSER